MEARQGFIPFPGHAWHEDKPQTVQWHGKAKSTQPRMIWQWNQPWRSSLGQPFL
jgi:hypothetical protein